MFLGHANFSLASPISYPLWSSLEQQVENKTKAMKQDYVKTQFSIPTSFSFLIHLQTALEISYSPMRTHACTRSGYVKELSSNTWCTASWNDCLMYHAEKDMPPCFHPVGELFLVWVPSTKETLKPCSHSHSISRADEDGQRLNDREE